MRSYQRTCEVCGVPFTTPRKVQRACGQTCGGVLRGAGTRAAAAKKRVSTEPPPEAGVRFVPLTQGKFAKVDEADFADVSRWNWTYWCDRSGREYAIRGESLFLHRYLMDANSDEKIDHKNGDGLDNRRENLRKATYAENNRNRRKDANKVSKYKGVSKHYDKWSASIWADEKKTWLGRFDSEEDAARAYDKAARRLFGEFARVNFPLEGEQPALH